MLNMLKSSQILTLSTKPEVVVGSMVGVITGLIGGWDSTIQVLLILTCIDIISGLYKGIHEKNFSSRKFREGLMNKAGYFLVVILAYQLDVLLGNSEAVIRNITVMFYIGVEGTSLLENLAICGIPVPSFIKDRLSAIKEKADSEEIAPQEK